MKVDFCLPAKNEEKIIDQNVRRLQEFLETKIWSFEWQIVIVVNGSSDSSWEIAQKLENERIKAVQVLGSGKGLAIKTGFNDSVADILAFIDVDLAVSLEDIPKLLEPLIKDESDLVMGSRLLPDSITTRSALRELSSKLYNLLSRLILSHQLSDLQCGFKAMKRTVFEKVGPLIKDDHWFFDTELVILTKHFSYRIKEIAINWQENRYDERKSKVRVIRDAWVFMKNLLILKARLLRMGK